MHRPSHTQRPVTLLPISVIFRNDLVMSVHISDSLIFRNSWGTPELRALFEEAEMVSGWIEVMAVLAETQAELGLIPARAAGQLANASRALAIDDDFLAEARHDFEQSSHSLLGIIKAVQRRCPDNCGEWLCYGATVQDITDTHTARILVRVSELFRKDLRRIARLLAGLAHRYRDVPMCGRTHGQPGLPITFGYKAAGWLDELLRHGRRFEDTDSRLGVGQLAGGVGSLSSFGSYGLELQNRFFHQLGLKPADISWTSSRDRIAEWLNLLALTTATADRIGHEIYNLQRPEIGELSEGFVPGTVGSITMPQKRNPEISEHLGTLSRLVRYQSTHMLENLVHDHERDGRSWKGEWAIIPPACLATGKALNLLGSLLGSLRVNSEKMRHNLEATRGFVQAEQIMLALASRIGKQSAHDLVYRVSMAAAESGRSLQDAVLAEPGIRCHFDTLAIEHIFRGDLNTGCCAEMVDRVLSSADVWLAGHGGKDQT
ncbi:MAG: class-II fumarase/aspartase family protein [Gammaproteobacteria bacterium]